MNALVVKPQTNGATAMVLAVTIVEITNFISDNILSLGVVLFSQML
ncbi:MAG: hypothetical protein ACPG7X_06130 [Flavobacteriaceae bacterium]